MSLKVEKAGLLTTVQDLGRVGYQKVGVVVSGAMDTVAHRVANLLVGNEEGAATLEFTLLGPTLRFEADHLICMTGASFSSRINGKPAASWRPVWVKEGAVLEIGRAKNGARGYLALAGGIQVPESMNSASTYLRAGIGGLNGKALQEGALIPCGNAAFTGSSYLLKDRSDQEGFAQVNWYPAPELLPAYQENPTIRVVKGPEYDWFTSESQKAFWEQPFNLTSQSDRMGYRVEGPEIVLKEKRELLSTAVTFGTIQVPAQGNPIVLMADHQTTGGYPRIAQVISADLPILAQTLPGKQIKFQEVSLEEAYQLYFRQEQNIEQIKRAISVKLIR
ncbi:biotin-dependent carboxyltransferase family protein [Sabulibacter ruber]|uniref:5-oxoprolinase subunit C family protein n=1 Tax=Sabulibacter ruber TaxID=2811901 RepID=UPI001A957204|nr:biotin-dependent carboxyltransferase family protein [Sabulibacter ruber]